MHNVSHTWTYRLEPLLLQANPSSTRLMRFHPSELSIVSIETSTILKSIQHLKLTSIKLSNSISLLPHLSSIDILLPIIGSDYTLRYITLIWFMWKHCATIHDIRIIFIDLGVGDTSTRTTRWRWSFTTRGRNFILFYVIYILMIDC